MTFRRRPDPPWIDEARKLRSEGLLWRQIAFELKVSEQVLWRWLIPGKRESRILYERQRRADKRALREGTPCLSAKEAKRLRRAERLAWVEKAKELRSRGNSWTVVARIVHKTANQVRWYLHPRKDRKNERYRFHQTDPDQGV